LTQTKAGYLFANEPPGKKARSKRPLPASSGTWAQAFDGQNFWLAS
jgi:hypothetical protein